MPSSSAIPTGSSPTVPFTGMFRDFVRIPPEARGVKLTFRVTVKAGAAKRTLTYWIQAK